MPCNCCDPPQDIISSSTTGYCTLHKLLATDSGGWGVAHTWGEHHCQDAASASQPYADGPRVSRIRSDGTDVYTLGQGCGRYDVEYTTLGADTFEWPVGVRKITVTVTDGDGNEASDVFTREPDDNSTRTDNLYVGDAAEDSWYFTDATLVGPAGAAAGKVVVTYHVKNPVQKWNASGVLQWEVETRLADQIRAGMTFEVDDGLLVVAVGSLTTPALANWLIAITTSTGEIAWTYELTDIPDRFGLGNQLVRDLAMAASGVYAVTSDFGTITRGYILRWDTSGNLLDEFSPGEVAFESGGFPFGDTVVADFYARQIVVDSDCHIYTVQPQRFSYGAERLSAKIVKYAPLDTGVEAGPTCKEHVALPTSAYSALLVLAEIGFLECVDAELQGVGPYTLSLSPDESVLYFAHSTRQQAEGAEDATAYCNLYQLDPDDLVIQWGRRTPGTLSPALQNVNVNDLSARDDGVLAAVRVPGNDDEPRRDVAISYDEDGLLEYQTGLDQPPVLGTLADPQPEGSIVTVAAGTSGVWYAGGYAAECDGVNDPDLDEGGTCCDDELEETTVTVAFAGPDGFDYAVPTVVADLFPPFACWQLPDGISEDCLTCLEGLEGDPVTWHLVDRGDFPGPLANPTWKARVRTQCLGEAGDCGAEHWVDLYAHFIPGSLDPEEEDRWIVHADFKCDGEVWACLESRYVVLHYGDNAHNHLWFHICCLDCEQDDPPSSGLCAWQWDATAMTWVLLQSFTDGNYSCVEESQPADPGSEDGEIQCTCPCGDPCVETLDGEGIWSGNCPCQVLPKQFVGTLYGLGCFGGNEYEVTYDWIGGCTWQGEFAPDDGCPGELVTHTLTEEEGYWQGSMTWNCAAGVKTAVHEAICDPLSIGPGDPDYYWEAGEISCSCCDGGGGFGGEPPLYEGCASCPGGAANTWRVSGLTGITDGGTAGCTGCDENLNREFDLTPLASCSWSCVDCAFDACGSNGSVTLLAVTSTFALLSFVVPGGGGGTTVYNCATFNCLTGGTFTLSSTGSGCDNWPATVTVAPA